MAIALTVGTDQATVVGLNNQSSASFVLDGGLYGFTAFVGAAGNIGLQRQEPGGSFVDAFTRLTASGYLSLNLAPGTYAFSGTSTNANASIVRIKLA